MHSISNALSRSAIILIMSFFFIPSSRAMRGGLSHGTTHYYHLPMPNCNRYKAVQRIINQGTSVQNVWSQAADRRVDRALHKVKTSFGVTDTEWRRYEARFDALKKEDVLPLPNTPKKTQAPGLPELMRMNLIEKTNAALEKAGVDKEHVLLVMTNDEREPIAGALQYYISSMNSLVHIIKLHEQTLVKKSPFVQYAIINHEIRHLVAYDSLATGMLMSLLARKGISSNKLIKYRAWRQLEKCMELRADQTAVHGTMDVARAAAHQLNHYARSRADNNDNDSNNGYIRARTREFNTFLAYLEIEQELTTFA